MKLSLAFLISLIIVITGCVASSSSDQTPGNSNAAPPVAANSTAPSQPPVDADVPGQAPADSSLTATSQTNSNPAPNVPPARQNVPTATIRTRDVKATAGRDVTVDLELESADGISVMVFSLDFDPAVFTYVSSKISPGAPQSAVLTVNAEQTATGKFGALIDSATAFGNGRKPLMTVVFHVAPEAPAGDYKIKFGSKPARQSVSTATSQLVDTKFEAGIVRITASR